MATKHFKLPQIAADQAQKHIPVNWSLDLIDAALGGVVASATTETPPASPALGVAYIVPPGSTFGAVTAGSVAVWSAGAWHGFNPPQGARLRVLDEGADRIRTATAWAPDEAVGASTWADLSDKPATVEALPDALGSAGQVLKVGPDGAALVWAADEAGSGGGGGGISAPARSYISGAVMDTASTPSTTAYASKVVPFRLLRPIRVSAVLSQLQPTSSSEVYVGQLVRLRLSDWQVLALLATSAPVTGGTENYIRRFPFASPVDLPVLPVGEVYGLAMTLTSGTTTSVARVFSAATLAFNSSAVEMLPQVSLQYASNTMAAGVVPGNIGSTNYGIFLEGSEEVEPLAVASVRGAVTGAVLRMEVIDAFVNLTGASVSVAGMIPPGAIVLGVSSWTVTAVAGAPSYGVGIAGEPTKFGGSLGAAAGSKNAGLVGPFPTSAAADVVVTATSGSFTAGRVGLALSIIRPSLPVS